jgi:hypothetical protein
MRAKREEGTSHPCHCYTSISLDREEPSRSLTPAIRIIARYNEVAKRS